MQWYGKPVAFNRFLGQVDQDDPTNLPVGLAALCRNTDFTRDSPGVTCAGTRAGINLAWQLIGTDGNKSTKPCTGAAFFQFSPELPTDIFFQMPIAYEGSGQLQRESPVGTGHSTKIATGALFTPPAGASMNAVPADNKVWAAFSDLLTASSGWACIDPKVIQTGVPVEPGISAVNPGGMKPVGWYWQPNTPVLQGEIACPGAPITGNGHTYQAQNSGTTGADQPTWPLTEGATVGDNGILWKELTMVLANRLPAPAAPVLTVGGGGTFPAAQDVYVVITLVNAQGETLPSLAAVASDVAVDASVSVAIPTLASMAGWIRGLAPTYVPTGANVYVVNVATGSPAPSISTYEKFNSTTPALGSTVVVTGPGTGSQPPSSTTARITPGQIPTPTALPDIERNPLAGTFAAGRDVYVLTTYTNALGETPAGPANSVINTVLDDGVQVTVAVPEDENNAALYSILQVGVYEADVPTGTPAPPSSQFQLVGYYAAGATPTITTSATGPNPPTSNGTGPGGNIAADTTYGGPNGGQGYRYAVPLFMNQNETVSGFTLGAVVGYAVDEDGWEIGAFNIPTGPGNVVARLVAFTVADSSQDGPFWWIGLIDLLAPAQNVVYPMQTLINSVDQSATAILDNVTTQATFNFTDDYLDSENNVDDRTDILAPFSPVRIDYLKTINSLAFTGVNGYIGGGLISIPGDLESVYADQGALPFPSDGQRCYGFTDAYKGVIFALREEGGFIVEPNSGNPSTWSVRQRWSDYGPCGFRAWAANGKLICFVHRSGFYKYDEADPDMMSKEIPRSWSRINWTPAAAKNIQVTLDEDTHTVRIQVPTGASMVNNEEFCLSYLEGWQNPIHFSTFSGKEISMDAARRWSFNDVAASFCMRMNRVLPPGPAFLDGPDWTTIPDSSYTVSQLLYGTSAFDGGIHARTPGVYSDNGSGIDWKYRTVCAGMMQAVCKPEGFNLNCIGGGLIYATFLAARDQLTGPGGDRANGISLDPIELDPAQKIGITRKCESVVDEYWSVEFDNGKQPGAWCSLKSMNVYMIPVTGGRGEWDSTR